MNNDLTRDFTMDEVKEVLQQMHPTKAPNPDGMSAIFYQKYWNIVGYDTANMVLNVLNSNASLLKDKFQCRGFSLIKFGGHWCRCR